MAKSPNITTAPTGNVAPFGLRMLPELRAQIEEAARKSGRSMNAEIVARLHASFPPAASSLAGTSSESVEPLDTKTFTSALENQRQQLRELVEASVDSAMKRLSDSLKEFEIKERQRLIDKALSKSKLFKESKKSKA